MENQSKTNEYMFGLIIDELDGSLTNEGKTELHNWRKADPANEAIYAQFYDLNAQLDVIGSLGAVDPSQSWDVLEGKLDALSLNGPAKSTPRWRWLSVAALLFATVSIGFFFYSHRTPTLIETAASEQKTLLLPDGSSLRLNGNTAIRYRPDNFASARSLELLRGEAFFTVAHDAAHEFSVALGKIKVTDLGTSFNIVRSGGEISVVVSTGKVDVQNIETNLHVTLNPGGKATYREAENLLRQSTNQDANYMAWVDKKLVFNNTPLPTVARILERVYRCKVVLSDRTLNERTLNATLNYQTADSALAVISETLQLKVKKDQQTFSILTR